jgi:signal transduction histidine kinase
MRIRTVLIGGMLASALTALSVAAGLYVTTRWTDDAIRHGNATEEIAAAVFRRNLVLSDYLMYPGPRAKNQWVASGASLERLLTAFVAGDDKSNQLLAAIKENFTRVNWLFARLASMNEGPQDDQAPDKDMGAGRPYLEAQLMTRIRDNMSLATELVRMANARSIRQLSRARWLQAGIGVGLAVVLVAFWIIIFRQVVRPLRAVREGIQKFGGGDLEARIGLKSDDEIGEVAGAFDAMAEKLKKTTDALAVRSRELEAVNKELEAFCYSVSHDLRAPLRGMDAFSQALIEDYGKTLNDEARDYLTRIRKGSQRMGQLIDDLLKLSRVSRGELTLDPVNLSDLARSVAESLRETASGRKVTFEFAPGLVAWGDRRLLQVAFENLIGNAWKYTSKHPSATIAFGATSHNGSRAYFVRDDGAGFDMAYADNLFKPFQRLHRVDEFDGTGIGLATVQRVIHRHGGEVWAEGAVEKGATIYFTL